MNRTFPLLAIATLAPLVLTSGKRRPEVPLVSFHLEAQGDERPRDTVLILIGKTSFRVIVDPQFTVRDVSGFYPFPSEDNKSFGAAFKLNPRAAGKLEELSTVARGRRLATVVDDNAVGAVRFDLPINDGYIVCWSGLSPEHFDQFKAAGLEQLEAAEEAEPEPIYAPGILDGTEFPPGTDYLDENGDLATVPGPAEFDPAPAADGESPGADPARKTLRDRLRLPRPRR